VTNDMIDEADMTEDQAAEDAEDAQHAEDAAAAPKPTAKPAGRLAVDDMGSPRSRSRWMWVSVALLVALVGFGTFGYLKYKAATDDVAALRQAETDRNHAAQMAKDYALKSLTYSFEDPDGFFRAVEDGVSDSLKDKYINANDLLRGVMLQAQVTSSGEVLATEATAQPGNVYQVVVSASQTTRNLQNPQPRVSIILLQITVNKVGDTWQVSDIGPKTGSQEASPDQPPAPKPGAGPIAPAPAPLPAPKP
jgi:Mce-associated membrane protein